MKLRTYVLVFLMAATIVVAPVLSSAAENTLVSPKPSATASPSPTGSAGSPQANTDKPSEIPQTNYADAVKLATDQTQSSYVRIATKVRGWWNGANDWLKSTIGLNIKQVLSGIGRLIVWVLNLLIHLLQYIVYMIQQIMAWQQ